MINNGDQGVGGESEERTEVFVAACAAVPVVRSFASGVPKVSNVPHLFSNFSAGGCGPRRTQSKLVGLRTKPIARLGNLSEGVDDVV